MRTFGLKYNVCVILIRVRFSAADGIVKKAQKTDLYVREPSNRGDLCKAAAVRSFFFSPDSKENSSISNRKPL